MSELKFYPPLCSAGTYKDASGEWVNLWKQCKQKDARIAELEQPTHGKYPDVRPIGLFQDPRNLGSRMGKKYAIEERKGRFYADIFVDCGKCGNEFATFNASRLVK